MTYTGKEWHAFCDAMNRVHRELDRLEKRVNMCVNCKKRQARVTSIYCSERCKREFLSFDKEVA